MNINGTITNKIEVTVWSMTYDGISDVTYDVTCDATRFATYESIGEFLKNI